MTNSAYNKLIELVRLEKYYDAEILCRQLLLSEPDQKFWRTQIGYIYFLNEKNDQLYYSSAPSTFKSLVSDYPLDINSHFWLGYIFNIVTGDIEDAKNELKTSLSLDKYHPYANIVMSGLIGVPESIDLLRIALEVQPTNFRVLRQLANMLLQVGQDTEALKYFDVVLNSPAYIEENYGIMNRYINDVLTSATHEQLWRAEIKVLSSRIHRDLS
jgi:tetratricopeptide (TPR) repeat protein